jgi:CheY-like chemotaxis protein
MAKISSIGKSLKRIDMYRILYVDDEETNLRIFEYAFRQDYVVFLAQNGEEALDIVRREHIDIIITDQHMPTMSGVELLKKIIPSNPRIVRMIMSGFNDVAGIVDAVNEIGINKYLQKPWDKRRLKSTIDSELVRTNELSYFKIFNDDKAAIPNKFGTNRLKGQNTFTKNGGEIAQVFEGAVILRSQSFHDLSTMQWVGKLASGQKILLIVNAPPGQKRDADFRSALYSMVTELVSGRKKIEASWLIKEIQNTYELRQLSGTSGVQGRLSLSILIMDDTSDTIAFASNYSGVKIFDLKGNDICAGRAAGLEGFEGLKRVFVFTETLNRICLGDLTYSQLIDESIEFRIDRQIEFLDQEIKDDSELSMSGVTVIGFDISRNL